MFDNKIIIAVCIYRLVMTHNELSEKFSFWSLSNRDKIRNKGRDKIRKKIKNIFKFSKKKFCKKFQSGIANPFLNGT